MKLTFKNTGRTHFKKGGIPWNKGIKIDKYLFPQMGHHVKHSEETKQKISLAKIGKNLKSDHWAWKGAYAGYRALHIRLGKAQSCVLCGSSGGEKHGCHWANMTGNYSDKNDYISLCPKCHKNYDLGKIKIDIRRSK
jgi:hypothetical protein